MAKGPSYRLPFRRRREGKTDYRVRKSLVLSKSPRVITRGSLRHMNVQIIDASLKGDEVIAAANSQELRNYGWQVSCGNIPSAYLTGLLCGARAVAKKVPRAIADIGLHQPTKGARIFAALKGITDGGIAVPCNAEKLPDEKRLKGQHIADYAKELASSNPELYGKTFSNYLKKKLLPEKLTDHFEVAREKILSSTLKGKAKKVKKKAKKKTRRKTRAKIKSKDRRNLRSNE